MKQQKRHILIVLFCLASLLALCMALAACGGKTMYSVKIADYDTTQGTVTVTPKAEDDKYEEGTELTVTVKANSGYELDSFKISADNSAALNGEGKYTFKVTADATITVTFKATTPPPVAEKFTVTKNTPENGTITLSPEPTDGKYAKDTEITVTLAPAQGYEVDTFTVGGVDKKSELQENVYKFNITADTAIAVTFKSTVVEVTNVTLDQTALSLEVGREDNKNKEATLTADVLPQNATNKTVTWQSDHPEFATVDTNGKVTAVAAGTATITAKAGDKEATCTVTVAAHTHTAKDTAYQTEGDKHYQLCECGAKVNEATHAAAADAEWQQDTANNKHYKLCVCGAHVDEAAHAAQYAEEWEYDTGDETSGKHYQLCICGEHVNESMHSMDEQATPDGSKGHKFNCNVCDYQTETKPHVNPDADGKWTPAESGKPQDGHYYICKDCDAKVTEPHEMTCDFTRSDALYDVCSKCSLELKGTPHKLSLVKDDETHHHYQCTDINHSLLRCSYATASVECLEDGEKTVTWTVDAENPSSGHTGKCLCGNTFALEAHDANGEGGKCSKCGYKEHVEHECADNPENGFYDGICDTCHKILNDFWTFDAAKGTIQNYNGSAAKVKIPSTISVDGVEKTVEAISAESTAGLKGLRGNNTVTDVIVPKTITSLPNNAFNGCTNLESAVILADINELPQQCFHNCKKLASLVLSGSIKSINYRAFGLSATAVTTVLKTIYWLGTQEQWETLKSSVTQDQAKSILGKVENVYVFSAEQSAGKWHWQNGAEEMIPELWS